MKIGKDKKIILVITETFEIYKCFIENLKFLGFEVHIITFLNEKFKYERKRDRFVNFIKKTFLRDKKYKKKLIDKFYEQFLWNKLEKIPKSDYSLSIRADLFEENLLRGVVGLAKRNYAYQWDGLSRFPEIIKLMPLFDKFYVFDKKDYQSNKNKAYPTTNFYFDCYKDLFSKKEFEYDGYFIGHYDDRFKLLISVCEILKQKGLKLNIILCHCTDKYVKYSKQYTYLSFIQSTLNFYENLKKASKARFLIDINDERIHKGLSFRIFESLGYDKKIITTNEIVKNYDFYNPNNILIINENTNPEEITAFLDTNYEEIDPIIKQKYSFTNWIKYILEIEEHIPIEIF